MNAVLLTGATTPFGARLARRLAESGRDVLAVGIEPRAVEEHARIHYEAADLTRPRQVRRLLFGPARKAGVRTIVHTALHRRARLTGPKVRRLNVDATRLLVRLAQQEQGIESFLFSSHAVVYRVSATMPDLLREDQPLNHDPKAPQWIRDRVEADVDVCMHMGTGRLRVGVLRCAEIFGPELGSQLWDFLDDKLGARPMGYDPMVELLSVEDAVEAFALAVETNARGILNIGGADMLPLSRVIEHRGVLELPVPGPLLGPLYALRALARGTDFRYDANRWRFHFNGVLDGTRAREELGYVPSHPIAWGDLPQLG